jgi:hypothetical protein
MGDLWETAKNMGRQGPAARTPGMWPSGEPARIRAEYDALLRRGDDGTRTKPCYACKGSGRNGGKTCTACNGSGSVPAA